MLRSWGMEPDTLLRFIRSVEDFGDGCWLWTGHIDQGGYGRLKDNNTSRLAHRLVYEHFVGPIPDDALICHTCDVRNCVNPDHLYAGSYATNAQDMHARLRARGGKPRKLTTEQALSIYRDPRSLSELARLYGIDKSTIARIKQGRGYREIHV